MYDIYQSNSNQTTIIIPTYIFRSKYGRELLTNIHKMPQANNNCQAGHHVFSYTKYMFNNVIHIIAYTDIISYHEMILHYF